MRKLLIHAFLELCQLLVDSSLQLREFLVNFAPSFFFLELMGRAQVSRHLVTSFFVWRIDVVLESLCKRELVLQWQLLVADDFDGIALLAVDDHVLGRKNKRQRFLEQVGG